MSVRLPVKANSKTSRIVLLIPKIREARTVMDVHQIILSRFQTAFFDA
jgi:hypothetical protein